VSKRTLTVCVTLAVLIGASVILRRALDIEFSPESIRAFVADAGLWAPIVFIGLVAFRVAILIPSQLLLIAAGVLFGTALGTLYGAVGMTISGLINFGLVRYAGAQSIRDRLPQRFDGVFELARSRAGAGAVVIGTGYPVGLITAVQLAAAVTGMSFLTYGIAVSLGALVRAATFSYFGSALLDGRALVHGTAVLVAAMLIPLLFPSSRAWLVANLRANKLGRRALGENEES
jgi:uncharacterized membrane protein YdjX (TVP38/TMEM64 family)